MPLDQKLNANIGFAWWKKYVAAAFWSNRSTPINLSITLLTALTTAQASTENLISQKVFIGLSVTTLILSVINTFFRPHAQMMENVKLMNQVQVIGNEFEEVYYSDMDLQVKQNKYKEIIKKLNTYEEQLSPETRNFFTDLIHVLCRLTCLKGEKETWLEHDIV